MRQQGTGTCLSLDHVVGGGRVGLLQISSVTDATGGYQVQLPEADAYSVSAGGAAPFSGVVRPTSALDIVNFYVHTGGCPTEYGRIVDTATRRPIAGAEVSWAGVTATSDPSGHYRLQLTCQPGAYGSGETTFAVSHPGYQPYAVRGRNAEGLGASPEDARLDIGLTPR